jgi:hypothetical protein
VALVKLSTSKSVTIKAGNAGKALVRTAAALTAKYDWHALVTYSMEDTSPVAQACDVIVQAAVVVAELAARDSSLHEEAEEQARDHAARQAKAVMRDAGRHAQEADESSTLNVGCASLLAALHSVIAAGEAVVRKAPVQAAAIEDHLLAPAVCRKPVR